MRLKHIYLAGGCFCGTEHFFKQIEDLISLEKQKTQTNKQTIEIIYYANPHFTRLSASQR